MAVVRYSPDHDVTFDLAHGLVHLEGAEARVLVPAGALSELCLAAGEEAVAKFGQAMGRAMGLRVAGRLAGFAGPPDGGDEAGASEHAAGVGTMVDQLGAELSLAGLGSLGLERWGLALVVVVDHCPLAASGDRLLAALVGEAVGSATGRAVTAVFLARDGVRGRFLLTSSAVGERVAEWLRSGVSWGEALTRLHAAPATSSSEAH